MIQNKVIVANHTLPFGWKNVSYEQEFSMGSLKKVLNKASSSDLLNEDPFPHLYGGYYSASDTSDMNLILEQTMPSTSLYPHLNHPAKFEPHNNTDVIYIGWPGKNKNAGFKSPYPEFTPELQSQLNEKYAEFNCHPVFLSPKEAKNHFEGYCKNRLWSVLHYSMWRSLLDFAWEQEIYDDYVNVNREFAKKVYENYKPGDYVLVIGYHLLLVPQFLKEIDENIFVCTFIHHIWPTSELFRCLPQAREILNGILASNVVGFQGHSYIRHFMNSAMRILGDESVFLNIEHSGRAVPTFVCPTGVNREAIHSYLEISNSKIDNLIKSFGKKKLILGIDSADHMRGIKHKLRGYQKFLKDHPEYRDKLLLVQVILPDVDVDPKAESTVMDLTTNINAEFGSIGNPLVTLYHQDISKSEYYNLLRFADIYLNTSERDSIPSTLLDYIMCQEEKHGQLVLSEFVALASYLEYAFRVNPWDKQDVSDCLYRLLNLNEEEKKMRISSLKRYANLFDLRKWSNTILEKMIEEKERISKTRKISFLNFEQFQKSFAESARPILFLDYDGTLAPIKKVPEAAAPDQDLLGVLEHLSKMCEIYVVSGRIMDTLEEWLGKLAINLAAEHGAFIRRKNDPKWNERIPIDKERNEEWKKLVTQVFEYYTERTPGSFIEQKNSSITWHYRLAEDQIGQWQAKECMNHIESNIISNYPIQLLGGKKNIEVRLCSANKGDLVKDVLEQQSEPNDFVFCAGDDSTDEDMFKVLLNYYDQNEPNKSTIFTCLVGTNSKATSALYNASSPSQLLSFLKNLKRTCY